MKIRTLFCGIIASLAALFACQEEEVNLGTPNIVLSETEMNFESAGGEQTLTVTASRDWMVETDADWVVVSPESGLASADAQTVTVTVLENKGLDRSVDVKFTIGMKSKYLTVSQAGPGGSAEDLIVYYNDYDKEVAEKTYGSGSSWPYLDQFAGWQNQTGTGAANVTYSYSGMSARANSTSDSNYSDYAGSGNNNMFFGKSAYLATKNIALGGATDFTLTFGTEKYSQDNGSVFKNSEFHIYLSNDGNKWVEFTDYTFAGGEIEGRWNVASAAFSVPEGTENLSICMAVDVASSYRMDDLKLEISETEGTAVDFSNAVEMDFTAGGSTGGSGVPESKGKKSVAEFIAAADKSSYYELTGKVSGFNPTYCSFDLTDDSGKIYVYSVLAESKAEWTSKISNGGTITIYAKYEYYEPKDQHEVIDAYIVSFTDGGDNPGGGDDNAVVYYNDYDKEVAEKTYGSGSSWPYLDQFAGWQNQTGTGAANVSYSYSGMSARANSTSDGSYSDYAGSGKNNMFFGKSAYLATYNIALGGKTDFLLTFGTEKYSQESGSVFKNSEFHIYLSNDGNKWVEFKDYSFAGGNTEGRWNVASAAFSVPAGTQNLSVCMAVDVASSYRMDDLKLETSATAGTVVDFSKGVEMDFSEGGSTGGGNENDGKPSNLKKVTLAEFLDAPESSDTWYELTGEITSIAEGNAYGNLYINDGTAEVYIYGLTNGWVGYNDKSFGSIGLKVGDTVTLGSLRGSYNGQPQGGGSKVPAYYISHVSGEGGNQGGGDDPTPPSGEAGEYDPQGITWTLGSSAYDNTSSGSSAQSAVVNGVEVNNLLKLGTGSKVGDATLHVPAGTKKLGFYCVAWNKKTAQVKFSVGGKEITTIEPAANTGAAGNPTYTITVSSSDYYEVEMPSTDAADVKVETLDPANGRVLFIGLKAITE